MKTIQEILDTAKIKRKKVDEAAITRAYEFAKKAHEGQKRKSGEPFFIHPSEVAFIIAEMGLDDASIIAGLLHDVVEDTSLPIEEIEMMFGKEVATLVAGETNLGHLKFISEKDEYQVENLRKMFMAMARDMRVILIKLADRLHNMRTMKYMPPDKRVRKSKETLEIYAPLASRLGMGQMRGELEDLAFQWVFPKQYDELKEKTRVLLKEGDRFISLVKRQVTDTLKKEKLNVSVEGRTKHLYSLYKKLQRPEFDNDLSKIPDLMAIRIIIESNNIEDCYIALGSVHQIWTPVPSRISDYIATPKSNGYRSLHTKVFVDKGRIMEVQIRTRTMHEQAEFGIASHIVYEQAKSRKGVTDKEVSEGFKATKEQLDWIHQLTSWQQDAPDSEGFLKGLKRDIFKDRIFVYTPKGDVRDLPFGATPIDFAYSVHSEIGDKAVGARIDGHLVPLNYQLRSGEIIEIITSREKRKPSPDWLQFVVTNNARKHIQKLMNIPDSTNHNQVEEEEEVVEVEETQHTKRPSNFPQAIPGSKYFINPMSIVEKARSALKNKFSRRQVTKKAVVKVHGLGGVATRLARCCHPLPGEDIIGFVTGDQVVSVHSMVCQNVANIVHKEKQIQVSWSMPEGIQKVIRMKLEMDYREGALKDVTKVLSDARVSVEQFEQLPAQDGVLKIQFVVGLDSDNQRNTLYSKLQRVAGIHSVE
jgi:GTP pyrophosphokinase